MAGLGAPFDGQSKCQLNSGAGDRAASIDSLIGCNIVRTHVSRQIIASNISVWMANHEDSGL